MNVHPQYTYDKDGKPVGVFLSIEEWEEVSSELNLELPQWQKDALDIELKAIATNPNYLQKWDDVKKQFLA
jgi:hypothetical protein